MRRIAQIKNEICFLKVFAGTDLRFEVFALNFCTVYFEYSNHLVFYNKSKVEILKSLGTSILWMLAKITKSPINIKSLILNEDHVQQIKNSSYKS